MNDTRHHSSHISILLVQNKLSFTLLVVLKCGHHDRMPLFLFIGDHADLHKIQLVLKQNVRHLKLQNRN